MPRPAEAASGELPLPANEVLLEGPERRSGPAADAGLPVDVLDVVPDGLGRDAEISAIAWLDWPRTSTRRTYSSRLVSREGKLARSLPHAVAGGSEHRVDSFRVEPFVV